MSYRKRFLDKLIERDGEFCAYCGSGDDLHVDHVVPRSKGGSNEMINLKVCCWTCNYAKRDKSIIDFKLSESLKRTDFHSIINYKQYQALLNLKLIQPIDLIDFYFEKIQK